MNIYKVFFDGSCWPKNPKGICKAGFVIYKNQKEIKKISQLYIPNKLEDTSNNLAEHYALLLSLKYLQTQNLNHNKILIYGDNMLVIKQMKGEYRIKKGLYKEIAKQNFEIKKNFSNLSFYHIPRELNTFADKLTHITIKDIEIYKNLLTLEQFEKWKQIKKEEKQCPQCGSMMIKRLSKFHLNKFWWGCSKYPNCTFTISENDE